jgi:hypothetical protein
MNAIAWATIRLRGTWKSYAYTTGGYALIIGMVFAYFAHMTGVISQRMMLGLPTILLFLQVLFLLFIGATAIAASIRRDLTNGLIASHRLMPVAPASAVIGYVLGPTLQVSLMAGVNVVAGCAASALGGLDVGAWLAANAMIALLVVFLWVFVAFTSFLGKNVFGAVIGVLFASAGGGGFLLALVPALAMTCTPILSALLESVTRASSIRLNVGVGYAVVAQFVFGAIFFVGAMRRYRRDDIPALGTRLSFLLLGAWVVASIVAVMQWNLFSTFNTRRGQDISITVQCVAATISSILVALVAVSASAKASTEWTRSVVTTGFAPSSRSVPPPILALLAAAMIFAMALGLRPQHAAGDVGLFDPDFASLQSRGSILFALRVAVVAAIYLLSISYLLRILFRAATKPFLLIAIWTGLTWLIPFGFDAARDAASTAINQHAFFARWSPVGELWEIWSHPDRTSIEGIVVQLLIAAVPAALFYSTEPKGVRAKLATA